MDPPQSGSAGRRVAVEMFEVGGKLDI